MVKKNYHNDCIFVNKRYSNCINKNDIERFYFKEYIDFSDHYGIKCKIECRKSGAARRLTGLYALRGLTAPRPPQRLGHSATLHSHVIAPAQFVAYNRDVMRNFAEFFFKTLDKRLKKV
jgi:hypothetical protein